MPLIKDNDIVTLRRYVRMNFTATAVKSMPDMDAAERKFLVPILTQPVFDALQLQVDAITITWTSLLSLCRAAAAPLAVWLDLPFMQAQISDRGLSSDDNAAHQWEFVRVETALVNKGMAALEDLIEHLIVSGSTYNWANAESKESFIRTGNEFSKYVYLHQPNLTFQQLKPLMREVEDHYLKAAIGEEFFIELRDNVSPSLQEKAVIQLIKKVIAQFTVVRAVERMPVKITPNGLMAMLQNNTEGNLETPAAGSQLDRLMKSANREGNAYQMALMQVLNKSASETIFKTFYDSVYYTAPIVVAENNFYRRGVIGM